MTLGNVRRVNNIGIKDSDRDKLDWFSNISIGSTILLLTFLLVYFQSGGILHNISIMILFMLIGGIVFRFMTPPLVDFYIDEEEASSVAFWCIAGVLAILFTQIFTIATIKTQSVLFEADVDIRSSLFIATAVGEECLFRLGFLGTALFAIEQSDYEGEQKTILYIIISLFISLVFMTFHWRVYAEEEAALVVTFIASMVLCFAYIGSKRLSVTIFIHVINNFIASNFLATILM